MSDVSAMLSFKCASQQHQLGLAVCRMSVYNLVPEETEQAGSFSSGEVQQMIILAELVHVEYIIMSL